MGSIKRLYLATSWRNEDQPAVVRRLTSAGYEVYDFRNPSPTDRGFSWDEVDPSWTNWQPSDFREALNHPAAKRGFHLDMQALGSADATILLLPSGRSAHLELGYTAGQRKPTFVVCGPLLDQPELMYKMASRICIDVSELLVALSEWNATYGRNA